MLARLSSTHSTRRAAGKHAKRSGERELFVVMALFWSVSLVRVIGAVVRHEVFGAEATVALMALVAIPWLVLGHRSGEAP